MATRARAAPTGSNNADGDVTYFRPPTGGLLAARGGLVGTRGHGGLKHGLARAGAAPAPPMHPPCPPSPPQSPPPPPAPALPPPQPVAAAVGQAVAARSRRRRRRRSRRRACRTDPLRNADSTYSLPPSAPTATSRRKLMHLFGKGVGAGVGVDERRGRTC